MNPNGHFARSWLAQYPRGVPHCVQVASPSLATLLADTVARYPDQQILDFFGR